MWSSRIAPAYKIPIVEPVLFERLVKYFNTRKLEEYLGAQEVLTSFSVKSKSNEKKSDT